MPVLRSGVTLVTLCCLGGIASAQQPAPAAPPPAAPPPAAPPPAAPQDPYAPDPVIQEQIAEQLVTRAQELLDAKIYLDAKQLAVEALVKSPKGPAAERARYIIKVVNQNLNIKEDPPPTPPSQTPPDDKVDLTPITDPTQFDPSRDPPPTQTPAAPVDDGGGGRNRIIAATVHGGLYGGVIGATIGAYINNDNPASVAVPLGIATGLGGALLGRQLARKRTWDEAQIRTVGSLNFWGGTMGGMFGWAVSGAGEEKSPTATGVLLGASLGATSGLLVGGLMAKDHKLTRGDVALVDTFAGIGAVGGLTMGMLMQPVQNEAYAVNSILGAAGGIAIGVIAGPKTNTTPRRMLRVAGFAAAGGALPFLLYAGIASSDTNGDERLVGALSSMGLVGGAYLGFRLTKGMDAGLDVHEHDKPATSDEAAPVAMPRSVLPPIAVAPNQRVMVFPLAAGSF
jgi:hypothetical protein